MKALSMILLLFSSICLFSCSKTEVFGNIDSLEGTVWEWEHEINIDRGTTRHIKSVLKFDKTTYYSEGYDTYINSNSEDSEEYHDSTEGSYIYNPPKLTVMNSAGSATATIVGKYLQFDNTAFYSGHELTIVYKRIK
jgi:hypothetical protein